MKDRDEVKERQRKRFDRADFEYAMRQVSRLEALAAHWQEVSAAMLKDEHKHGTYTLAAVPESLARPLLFWRTRAHLYAVLGED